MFLKAYIVSEAYDKKSDWSQALFNQFILNNNEKYLIDFKAHINISSNVIEETVNRYKIWTESNKPSAQTVQNIKKLIKFGKDIGLYYKYASMLELKDLIDEIQTKKYSSIISDMIFNKKI